MELFNHMLQLGGENREYNHICESIQPIRRGKQNLKHLVMKGELK